MDQKTRRRFDYQTITSITMHNIDSGAALKAAILQLESNRADGVDLLKMQFHLASERLKPINLLKSTFKYMATSQELHNTLLNTSIGLAAGYLSKTLFERTSNGPLKKVFGTALMIGMINVVAQNPETVKAVGRRILSMFRSNPANKTQTLKA